MKRDERSTATFSYALDRLGGRVSPAWGRSWLLLTALALASVSGCGDDPEGPTAPTRPTTTTSVPPSPRADVAIRIDRVEPELSPVQGKRFRLTWHITLTERAGVGASLNFMRQEIWNRDFDQYERSEIGVSEIADHCGTRIVRASSDWQCRVPFDFTLSNFEGLIRLTVTLYDDFDHLILLRVDVPLSEPEAAVPGPSPVGRVSIGA